MRGRKRTTGKFQTVEELEEAVQFFSQTQSEFQTARTCGVSATTVRNILERAKKRELMEGAAGLENEIAFQQLEARLNTYPN